MQFRFTTAGESHGKALIAIVEGVPYGLAIDKGVIDRELKRRQQGYGRGGRMKIESDAVEILSGVRHGRSIGSPIALMIENRDFVHWRDVMNVEPPENETGNPRVVTRPRPGHADLAGGQKFGARDLRDVLERASARETAARVAAGAVAKQLLAAFGIEILSHVIKLGSVQAVPLWRPWEEIAAIPDDSPLRCADDIAQREMIRQIDNVRADGDTLGGVFEVAVRGVPAGLGSHTSWEEKLDGRLARAVMSVQAVKAVEIGEGVANSGRRGSEAHDEIFFEQSAVSSRQSAEEGVRDRFARRTNRAGGIEGGIANGEEIRIRGYMKPISTLRKPLASVDIETKEPSEAAFERSDITAVPAAGVIAEAMTAVVLADEMRRKFGGDSIDEMRRNYDAYLAQLSEY
jgi:chorismate synthase